MTLPDPLAPPDCDLRAFDWFPFYHKQFRQSAFWKRASDAACRVSVELWSEAYEQVPAASLPDDDIQLSDWAGFGRRNLSQWLEIKAEVMSAWVKCSDGRWYHPVLARVACAAWAERLIHFWQRECDRIRKENKRRQKDDLPALELPPRPDVSQLSGGKYDISGGNPDDDGGIPAENALKGKGTGREIEEYNSVAVAPELARADETPAQRAMMLELVETVRVPDKPGRPRAPKPSRRCPAEWSPSVATIETLVSEGYRPGQLERELAILRDHEFKTPRSDWDACFRNWIRRSSPQTIGANYEHTGKNLRSTAYAERLQDIGSAMDQAFRRGTGGPGH